jgi:hypothetical protein
MDFSYWEVLGTDDAQKTDAAEKTKSTEFEPDPIALCSVEPDPASRKNYIGMSLGVSIDDN